MGLIYSETYSGNAPVSNTISATSKTVLCDGIKVELVNAGWSVISGSSGSWILESGGNHPNGFQHRLQLNDSGTNCARVRLYSPYTAALYLHLYPNSETYRIIATAYDFWCYSESLSSDNRRFMAFVQPFLPTEVQGSPASITQITAGNGAWDDASFSGSLWRVIGGDQAYNLINGGNHIGQIGNGSQIIYQVNNTNILGLYPNSAFAASLAPLCIYDGITRYRVGYIMDAFLAYSAGASIGQQWTYDTKTFRVVANGGSTIPVNLAIREA